MKPFLTRGGALRGNAAPAATLLTAAATLLRIESRDACILGLRNSRHGYLMLMARFSQIVIKITPKIHTQNFEILNFLDNTTKIIMVQVLF